MPWPKGKPLSLHHRARVSDGLRSSDSAIDWSPLDATLVSMVRMGEAIEAIGHRIGVAPESARARIVAKGLARVHLDARRARGCCKLPSYF